MVEQKIEEATLGGFINAARRVEGLTLLEVAFRIGRPSSWLSKVENDKAVPNECDINRLLQSVNWDPLVAEQINNLYKSSGKVEANVKQLQIDISELGLSLWEDTYEENGFGRALFQSVERSRSSIPVLRVIRDSLKDSLMSNSDTNI